MKPSLSEEIISAVDNRDIYEVSRLIKWGADVNASANGLNLVARALLAEDYGVLLLLAHAGADFTAEKSSDPDVRMFDPLLHAPGDLYQIVSFATYTNRPEDVSTLWEEVFPRLGHAKCSAVVLFAVSVGHGPKALMHAIAVGNVNTVSMLLRNGVVGSAADTSSITGLMVAIGSDAVNPSRAPLDTGVWVDMSGGEGMTALMWATALGEAEIVDKLLAAGADVHAKENFGLTAVMFALSHGQRAIVAALRAAGADGMRIAAGEDETVMGRPQEYSNGMDMRVNLHKARLTALWWAVNVGHEETLAVVLKDATAMTQLVGQAATQRDAATVSLLLRHKAHIETRDMFSRTPLIRAIDSNAGEVLRVLLAARATVECWTNTGVPALAWAALNSRGPMVRDLLAAGACVATRDSKKRTALMCAMDASTTQLLVDAGADVHAEDEDGYSVFSAAVKYRPVEVVKVLLQNGVDVNSLSANKTPPLIVALRARRHDTVPVLLAQGADVSPTPADFPPLMLAVEGGSVQSVRALLHACADVTIADGDGRTALMYVLLDTQMSASVHVAMIELLARPWTQRSQAPPA